MDDAIGVEQADARFGEIRAVDPLGPKLPPIAVATCEQGTAIRVDLELPNLEILSLDRDDVCTPPAWATGVTFAF